MDGRDRRIRGIVCVVSVSHHGNLTCITPDSTDDRGTKDRPPSPGYFGVQPL